MELDELKTIWKKQEIKNRESLSKEQLSVLLNNKMISFDEKIKSRDRREIGAAIFVSFIFGILLFVMDSIWTKLGCVTIILACGFISYKLITERRAAIDKKSNPNTTFKENLQFELQKVETQRNLLKNIVWWYIAPIFLGSLFFFIGIYGGITLILHIIFMIVVSGLVWGLNQHAVSKYIDPIINDIENAIQFVEDEN
jgi:Flp pilus assembly protein TadB